MASYVIGAAAGVVAGLACVFVVGGVVGIVAGVAVAVLLYFGVGRLLAPEAKLGNVAASLVPNGEAAASKIFEARALADKVQQLGHRAHSSDVHGETDELAADIRKLACYVEKQPATYGRLSHFLATYGEACTSVLENYLAVEVTGTAESRGHTDVIEALNALEGAAQGELQRAAGAKVAELSADSDAVRRLMEMDGYSSDARTTRKDGAHV